MIEDQDKEDEGKIDFTPQGEALGYISLDQARVLAMRTARDNPAFYGPNYPEISLVWEIISQESSEDYYDIKLSFRPAGHYEDTPGIDQFMIEKTGIIRVRQLLAEPSRLIRP